MEITLLGTGTPAPSLKRLCSGYVVALGNELIVFDHGAGVHHRFLESGLKTADVTHVFFSHLHYDHCMDYPRLVLQRWDMGADKIPDLKVFGPPPLLRLTNQLFGDGGIFDPDITARIKHQGSVDTFRARGGIAPRKRPNPQVMELRPGDVVDGGVWKVSVGRASHVQPYLECYAYRLDTGDGSLCYSGDSGGVCPELAELAAGTDILLHMNHFRTGTEPTECFRATCGNHLDTAELARQTGCKTLVLTHILEEIDQPRTRERILREMMSIFDGDIVWGEDLMRISVSGP